MLAVGPLGTHEQIEQDRIEGAFARNDAGHILDRDADARVIHGTARQRGERPATPVHDGCMEFRDLDPCALGKYIERRTQRETHPETPYEHTRRPARRQSLQGQLRERSLASVCRAPHQHTPVQCDQEVARIALT